jgi:hypothetical protein
MHVNDPKVYDSRNRYWLYSAADVTPRPARGEAMQKPTLYAQRMTVTAGDCA